MDSAIYSRIYWLKAEARFAHAGHASITKVTAEHEVTVSRAKVQMSPPLNASAKHRSGPIEITLKFSENIDPTQASLFALSCRVISGTEDSWTLIRVIWKLLETSRVAPLACVRHKGLPEASFQSSTQTLAQGEFCGNWEINDQNQEDGVRFGYAVNDEARDGRRARLTVSCNEEDDSSARVSHRLGISLTLQRKFKASNSLGADADIDSRIIQITCPIYLARCFLNVDEDNSEAAPAYADIEIGPPSYLS